MTKWQVLISAGLLTAPATPQICSILPPDRISLPLPSSSTKPLHILRPQIHLPEPLNPSPYLSDLASPVFLPLDPTHSEPLRKPRYFAS